LSTWFFSSLVGMPGDMKLFHTAVPFAPIVAIVRGVLDAEPAVACSRTFV
jgi:hypothetical protein